MSVKPYARFPMANDPVWLVNAFAEVGTKEIEGAHHHPRVVEYHQCTGLGATDDETPWCSSFMCFVMQSAGIVSTRSAASLSWLRWGKELDAPVRGCVVIFERIGADGLPIPNRGHVALYVGENERCVHVLGGNQRNQVAISPYRKDRVIGYRWPALPHNSTTNMASTVVGTGAATAAAPAVIDVVSQVAAPEADIKSAATAAKNVANEIGIPVTNHIALVGLVVVILGLIYIVRERNKKIKKFGI